MKAFENAGSLYRANEGLATHRSTLTDVLAGGRLKKLLLVGGDLAVLYTSLFLSLTIRFGELPSVELIRVHFFPFTAAFGLWIVAFYIFELYELATSKNHVGFYNRLIRVIWINCAIATAYFYVLPETMSAIRPQIVLLIFACFATALFPLWRYRYNSMLQKPTLIRNVLVIGINEGAAELIEEITHKPQLGYRITAIVHNLKSEEHLSFPGVSVHDDSVDLRELLVRQNISTVVTAFDPQSDRRLIERLYESLSLKLQFFDLPAFYETLTGKIPITNIGHLWFLENLAESDKGLHEIFKRIFDVSVAVVLLVGFIPFFPLVALLIKLSSRGPVFFRQNRTGLLGRPFRVIKFRTMSAEAESDGKPRWAEREDPRVTSVGRFLRRTRIDEVPQLINVLRGEMSVIGPRPERPEFVRDLEQQIPFYNERHLVKPGLTGWAQIKFRYGSSVSDSFRKLQYDFFYIKNRSIALDIGIFLRTINTVLCAKGQ